MNTTTIEAPKLGNISAFTVADIIPPFWKKDPELWFYQIEAVFAKANITNSLTKFQTIIPKIDPEGLKQVSDIVNRPSESPYEDLKDRLIKVFTDPESRRIQHLLANKHLGDLKPSELLKNMRQLGCGVVEDFILKRMWLCALPQNIQAVLVITGQSDLNILANIADKVQEVAQSGSLEKKTIEQPPMTCPLKKEVIEDFCNLLKNGVNDNLGEFYNRWAKKWAIVPSYNMSALLSQNSESLRPYLNQLSDLVYGVCALAVNQIQFENFVTLGCSTIMSVERSCLDLQSSKINQLYERQIKELRGAADVFVFTNESFQVAADDIMESSEKVSKALESMKETLKKK